MLLRDKGDRPLVGLGALWFCPTYVRQSLVLLHQLCVGLQQRFGHLVKVVLKLLHPLLKVVNLLLGLLKFAHKRKKK